MISIVGENGDLIRAIPTPEGQVVGYHPVYGFVSERTAWERFHNRKHHGLKSGAEPWVCHFKVRTEGEGETRRFILDEAQGCELKPEEDAGWALVTEFGKFKIVPEPGEVGRTGTEREEEKKERPWWFLIGALPFLLLLIRPSNQEQAPAPTVLPPPVTVKVMPAPQKTVSVPTPVAPQIKQAEEKRLESKTANNKKTGGAMVDQNLQFLKLLGNNKLSKALGGARTKLQDASDGAGAGGKEGSGGELLVGLGEGVKRTTVGNSGVAGLGGIGTHGAGGGKGGVGSGLVGGGGAGNLLNGIGDGKKLSSQKLSDDIVLDGGLDRAVIQATIAKYLSQVRACYEERLRLNPGLLGQVTMRFEIGPQGNLNYSRVARSSMGDPVVGECIARKMMTWQFPKPVGGVNVKVSYPFLLRPVNT